jgi:ubiquinone/menaquinone biosynthesis C-methylase UbiE
MFHPQGPTVWELLVQALSSTERGYDLLAPKFEYTPFRTPDAILVPALAHLGGPRSIATALDVCCGTGAALRHLRPLCRDRVVGIDVSRGMLEVARRMIREAPGNARIDLVRGNVLAMPFHATFDVAVCFGALGHILPQEQVQFVSQVAHVLKPGGRVVCVTTLRPPWWSARYWRAQGFNALMHLRNGLLSPPFIMYYLTFLLPEAVALLRQHGFAVTVYADVFPGRFQPVQLVIATLTDRTRGPRTTSAWPVSDTHDRPDAQQAKPP